MPRISTPTSSLDFCMQCYKQATHDIDLLDHDFDTDHPLYEHNFGFYHCEYCGKALDAEDNWYLT